MSFVCREENVIQPEEEPVNEHASRPDQVEERKKGQAFAGKAGGCIFWGEEWTVECAPE